MVEEFLGKTMLNPTMYSNVHEEQKASFDNKITN
jgi:hypothetical protein